ncbi:YiiX/YebB-like N1pC/P60 family cysteine hydrolase [Massilia niastensis]|uniref:YiiX/YebB-like N1pC/P60 family cysteine hydrolase n=1 Tax=Massilia niastensis TaxID=544911 RepID=UPI0009FD682F|nr:YiiX/YebB-like N1pC/P60 family cysteine hydrolase [Massilia niastensis]
MAAGRLRGISKAALLALIAASACLPLNGIPPARGNPSLPRLDVYAPPLRDGDIVLRRGLDMMSRLVLTQGDAARFSHVGLIVVQQGVPQVLHAMPQEGDRRGGVILEPLAAFMSPSDAAEVAIYRSTGLTDTQRAAVKQAALTQRGLPFDERFELSNTEKVYCTGLVLRAYAAAGLALADARAWIEVPFLPEPVVPPDHLRRYPALPLTLIASSSPYVPWRRVSNQSSASRPAARPLAKQAVNR